MQDKQTALEFMRTAGFRRIVGSLVISTQILAHSVVFADTMSDVGRSAQADGQVWMGNAPLPSGSGNTVNLGSGQSLNTQDLYPGTSQEGNWFPDGSEPNIGELQSVFESAPGMEAAGDWRKAKLWQDAHSDNPSVEGAAYKVLLDAAQNNRHEQAFETDPSFQTTNTVFANAEEFANSFGDCSVVYTPKQITRNIHMPDEQMCERFQKPQVDCDITHTIHTETYQEYMYTSIFDIEHIFPDYADLYIDLKTGLGVGKLYEANSSYATTININLGKQIDYAAVCSSGDIQIELIDVYGYVDSYPSCANGLILGMYDSDSGYNASIEVTIQITKKTVQSDSWQPQSCIDEAVKLDGSGFCKADFTVLQGATNESTCINVSGIQICPGDANYNKLKPSPVQGIPRLAQKVRVNNVRCGVERENICFFDEDGEYVCTSDMTYDAQGCKELEENPQCALVKSECDPDSMSGGACTRFEDTYDCGYGVDVPTTVLEETIQCAGEIRCMGTDCLDVNKEDSMADMTRAIALLQAAEQMGADSTCTPNGAGNEMACNIFPGKEYRCKKPAGILGSASYFFTNCCKKPQQGQKPNLAQFVMAVVMIPQVQTAIGSLAGSAFEPLQGTWQSIKDGAANTLNKVISPFTSKAENAAAYVGSGGMGQEQIANETAQALRNKSEGTLTQMLGGSSSTASQILNAGGQAMAMFNAAMMYVQIAKLIIGLIWHCNEKDIELDVQKQYKNCVHIGTYCSQKVFLLGCIQRKETYCCFNSPLSRILQQQVRKQPQIGMGWGSPQAPNCGPISTTMLERVDWEQVNLDEWIAILHATGQLPDASKMTMDALTGPGSFLDTGGTRLNVEQRTMLRMDGLDVDAARREAADSMVLDTGAP